MLLSFQPSWFSFASSGVVPTVNTLAVTVAIVNEKVPCPVLPGNKRRPVCSPLWQEALEHRRMCSCALIPSRPHSAYRPHSWQEQAGTCDGHWSFPSARATFTPCVAPAVPQSVSRLHTCLAKRWGGGKEVLQPWQKERGLRHSPIVLSSENRNLTKKWQMWNAHFSIFG